MRSSFFAVAAMTIATIAGTFFATSHADACAGLIGSNGAVNLGRTTTLAAYHNGEEHYVTSFEFQGTGGGEFGTLIPLPGIPSNVEKGGAWTLQRLIRETQTKEFFAARATSAGADSALAEVLIEKKIDALDITVLRGGGPAVATWAQEHGFRLSPDAPEVLDFYAQRSPIFLAAVFDGDAAIERGQSAGDGTPVHLTIPTDNPWVPLRILGLGKQDNDRVEADVYLLTDEEPRILPGLRKGLSLEHSDKATDLLLSDLRSDEGMAWVPKSAWLTKLSINSSVRDLTYDLAVDADGDERPSAVAAGLEAPQSLPSAFEAGEGDDNLGRNLLLLVGIATGVLGVSVLLAKLELIREGTVMIWAFRAAGMALVATLLATAAIVVMAAGGEDSRPVTSATISIHFSKFETRRLTVPAGVPVTFVLQNQDPIEHEWMVGDDAMHARHRTGTEPHHDEIPTEVTLMPFETRTTVVQFDEPGDYEFVCHLPGHEQYGMKGVIRVVGE